VLRVMRQLFRAFAEAPELDTAIALAAFVALLADPVLSGGPSAHVTVGDGVLAGATVLPLILRRRYPLAVLTIVSGGLLACLAAFHPNFAAVAVEMLAVYTVGLQGRRLRSLLVGAAMAPLVTAAVAITDTGDLNAGSGVARLAFVLAALAAGDAMRGRRALLEAAAHEAEREHEAAARHSFDEERLRLAHELHDTVAHTLVAINVRAAAAAHLQRRNGSDGSAALEEIKQSSADALAELRSTLKLFRGSTGDVPMRPAQSLADLPELIDGVSGAGVNVELDLDVVPETLPGAVAHAAYRIVQESLTNVLRHSSAEHAVVRVGVAGELLTVEVLDDGREPIDALEAPGHGLRGMSERATALGGRCEAGVAPSGGWQVRALLPLSGRSG
jgi:signal transduction histidine kinase